MSTTFEGPVDRRHEKPINQTILRARLAAFDAIKGPRVGDFLELTVPDDRCRNYTRFTHDWGDSLQTGGSEYGSYYLYGEGGCSYSGGLDSGVATADLIATPRTRNGVVWFFDEGSAGAGRGVDFTIPHRVFTLREGANIDGIAELRCPFHLDQPVTPSSRYWYLVTTTGYTPRVAFEEPEDLHTWLTKERLVLTKPLTPKGTANSQRLGWPTPQ